jgi:hypothetical protein
MKLTKHREAKGKISLLPRWVHYVIAGLRGMFWEPCPLCGRMMGGHEWRAVDGQVPSIPQKGRPGYFRGICPVCTYEGKGREEPLRRYS